jgi:hypothetical protein
MSINCSLSSSHFNWQRTDSAVEALSLNNLSINQQ